VEAGIFLAGQKWVCHDSSTQAREMSEATGTVPAR
jgi:hypothetical protein